MKDKDERYKKEIALLMVHKTNLIDAVRILDDCIAWHDQRDSVKFAISMIDAEIEAYEKLIAMGV